MSSLDRILFDLPERLRQAVVFYWNTRNMQKSNQAARGGSDQGNRSAVTGGAQMEGFLEVFALYLRIIGIPNSDIFFDSKLELPGFFRPNTKWDLLVIPRGQLVLALEAKSKVGSFGNNFNNRTEEAMGSALDLWTAFREGAFNPTGSPWLGYIFLLQDCPDSRRPVCADEPPFPVLAEFRNASYAKRYELLCRKPVRERHYQSAAFLLSDEVVGPTGHFIEPAPDLTLQLFMRSLLSHAISHALLKTNDPKAGFRRRPKSPVGPGRVCSFGYYISSLLESQALQ